METLIDATPESWMDTLFTAGLIQRYSNATRNVIESYQYYLRTYPDCFPSQQRIAKNAMVSVRTVKTVLKLLQKAGLITVKASKAIQQPDGTWKRSTNRYFVTERGARRVSCRKQDLLKARKRQHRARCAAARKRYSTEVQVSAPRTPLKGSNRPAETVQVSQPVDKPLSKIQKRASFEAMLRVKQRYGQNLSLPS